MLHSLLTLERRKEVQVSRLETGLIRARAALKFSQREDFTPDTVYQDDTLSIFHEY